jgi:hypothetical protein
VTGTVFRFSLPLTIGKYALDIRVPRRGTQSVEKKHGTDFSNTVQHTVEECPSKFFKYGSTHS